MHRPRAARCRYRRISASGAITCQPIHSDGALIGAKVRPELAGLVDAWRTPLFNDFVHVGKGLVCFPSGTPADAACIKVVLDTCTLDMLLACVLAGPPGTIPDPSLLKDLAEQGSR